MPVWQKRRERESGQRNLSKNSFSPAKKKKNKNLLKRKALNQKDGGIAQTSIYFFLSLSLSWKEKCGRWLVSFSRTRREERQ